MDGLQCGASVDEETEPEEPKVGDCCGEGCNPCVYDIYRESLKRFKAKRPNVISADSLGLDKIEFKPFRLTIITPQTKDTSIYRFESSESISIKIGQHLELLVPCQSENGVKEIVRKYSPIAWTDTSFDVIIKRYANGEASKYFDKAEPGNVMSWRGPYGNFSYSKDEQEQLVILCAGTGIAPVIPIIRTIVENSEDETTIKLLCGSHTLEDRLLMDTLNELKAFWNFVYTHYVTSNDGEAGWGEKVVRGRIQETDILNVISASSKKSKVLICGSDSFCDDMKETVRKTGADFHCF
ncbi:NADH-cytochrome b5 reductase-like [Cloeon dipterum]|uniref:NADH-cytochrome b5 reductase-like n=1 Tax=Cloeon dipterum TaxID=197152 RepID=UPI00321F8670